MSAVTPRVPTITERWVNTLWPDLDGNWLSIFAQTSGGDRVTLWAQDSATAAAQIEPIIGTHNVWLGCASRRERLGGNRRGGAEECVAIPGLWLDIDIKGPAHAAQNLPETVEQALEALDEFPIKPSIIVHSGNGLQPWWLFAEPLDVADASQMLDDWAWTWEQILDGHGWQLDGVFDLARVLRVPGTLNHKSDPARPVTIQNLTGARYGSDDIDQWLQSAPAKPEPARKSDTPYIGPQRAGDHFNMAHTGGEILSGAGWELVRTDRNGDEHYRHPNSSNETSATVYADDGHTTIWTTSYPELQAQRPYDPFGLYAAMRHGSRFSEARRALSEAGYGAQHETNNVFLAPAEAAGHDAPAIPVAPPNPLLQYLITEDELNNLTPPEPLIEGWLFRHSLAFLTGPPKKGKTFIALDIAMSVANGVDWVGGTATSQGKVLYIVGEGTSGIARRTNAWRAARGIPLDGSDNIKFLRRAAQLKDHGELRALLEICEMHKPDLVIVDTFARAAVGVEENSAKEVGEAIAGLDAIKAITGACVLVIHHSGKDTGKGYRGSSALGGAWDTSITVDGDTSTMTLRNDEQKDVEAAEPIGIAFDKIGGSIVPRRLDTPPVTEESTRDGDITSARLELMSAIRRERKGEPMSKTDWVKRAKGRDATKSIAFWEMVGDGYFVEVEVGTVNKAGDKRTAEMYLADRSKMGGLA